MQKCARFAVLIALIAGTAAAAEPPYLGKWKLNPSKSDFGEQTITYEQAEGGALNVNADGVTFTIKPDGKDYPTPWGSTASWQSIDPTTWKTTEKVQDKVTMDGTMKLSADDKTLTMDSKMFKADGGSSDNSMVFQRVSGGPGLVGKWKAKIMSASAPGTLEIARSKAAAGVLLRYPDQGGECEATFDGRDHPASGKLWPQGWTCSATKSGASSLVVRWKKDGKLMYASAFTPSADGKTLAELSGAAGTSEKAKIHYDREAN